MISNAQPFTNVTIYAIASTKLQNTFAIVETRFKLLKKLVLEYFLYGIWDKFLMENKVKNSVNEYKKSKKIK